MIKRKGTTSKNILDVAYDEEKSKFLKRIHTKVETLKISEDLNLNWYLSRAGQWLTRSQRGKRSMELMTSVKSRIHVLIKTVYFITLSCQEGINERPFLYSANMKWNKSEYKYLLRVHRSTFRHNTFLVVVNVCYC